MSGVCGLLSFLGMWAFPFLESGDVGAAVGCGFNGVAGGLAVGEPALEERASCRLGPTHAE